jgi:hypothetical protein
MAQQPPDRIAGSIGPGRHFAASCSMASRDAMTLSTMPKSRASSDVMK